MGLSESLVLCYIWQDLQGISSVMLFFTVLIIEILSCAEVDMFVPSFPEIQRIFQLTPFDIELTMSSNLITYCLTALWVGAMGDRYGRKPLILGGLLIFILGSTLCVFAPNFWTLLLGRALQGIGMAGPATLGYVVIADHFSVQEQQKKMGTLNGAVSLSMAAAPILGSYISLYFHWRGNFVALLAMGMVALILVYFFIPKAVPNSKIKVSLKQYLPVFKSQETMLFIFIICFITLNFWVFIGISPILYMEDLGVSLDHFGFYQGALAGSFACISFSSGFLLKYFGEKKCFYASYIFMGLFLISCLGLLVFNVKSPGIITAVMALISIGMVMPINIMWPITLEIIPGAKGRVSGIFVAIRMILTSIGLQSVSYFYTQDSRSIMVFMILITGISLLASYKLMKIRPLFTEKQSPCLT